MKTEALTSILPLSMTQFGNVKTAAATPAGDDRVVWWPVTNGAIPNPPCDYERLPPVIGETLSTEPNKDVYLAACALMTVVIFIAGFCIGWASAGVFHG